MPASCCPVCPCHLIQRGNNRAACFRTDGDRAFYLHHLREALELGRCALHAYCLMDNHVHLLVTPSRASGCARLMKWIGQLHAQCMNRTHGRSGTLWEGRFRSGIVQSERYLLACHRYIELNPVRAGMVRHPRDHRWSSYRGNAEGAADPLLTPHEEYLQLGTTDAERHRAYAELFASELAPEDLAEIREAASGGFVLGDKGFRDALAVSLGRRVARGSPGRPARQP
jgi:putative transposase